MTRAELQAKYPKARLHREPDPTCKRCSGTGEEPARTLKSGTRLNPSPCMCVFVEHHLVGELSAGLARAAKSLTR